MSLLRRLSQGMGLPRQYLKTLSRSASHHYREFTIPKRDGGVRTIHHPSRELKAVQRWLLRHVVEELPVHDAATAYRRGVGIRANALVHADSHFLLRVDLEDFFPSITDDDISGYMHHEVGDWTDEDVDLFASLVCRFGCLCIGAPTSPGLSNSICYDLDTRIQALVRPRGVEYTRYADDLFFSTRRRDVMWDMPDEIQTILEEVAIPAGLSVNSGKTRHSSRKGKRQVTGLVLTPRGRVTIGRDRKRTIRAMIHQYDDLSERKRRELAGLLAFAKGVEPDFINALILKYGKAPVDQARTME